MRVRGVLEVVGTTCPGLPTQWKVSFLEENLGGAVIVVVVVPVVLKAKKERKKTAVHSSPGGPVVGCWHEIKNKKKVIGRTKIKT